MRGDAIRLGAVNICDIIHDEILENIFSRESLHYDELILEGEVESGYDESEFNKHTRQLQFTIQNFFPFLTFASHYPPGFSHA